MGFNSLLQSGFDGFKSKKVKTAAGQEPGPPISIIANDIGIGRAYNNGAATISFLKGRGTNPSSYTVQASPGGYTATSTSSPIILEGLQSGVEYTFSVVANATGATSSPGNSNAVTATTVPQAPTLSSIISGFKRATVSYSANSNGGKAINLYKASNNNTTINDLNGNPITFSELTGGVDYNFSVVASNENGDSEASLIETGRPWEVTNGSITEPGDGYRYHTFTGSSSFTVTPGNGSQTMEYRVIGGGGGGGSGMGGGGGAGYLSSGSFTLPSQTTTYSLSVGGGGGGGGNDGNGGFGTASSITGIATGARGGRGGGFQQGGAEGGGGSTGGGVGIGGGASGGNGGPGSSVFGTTIGGGGGGGTNTSGFGLGGSGGGGNGAPHSTGGSSAQSTTGSGGGGGGAGKAPGGSGGSGRVVVRYLI
jgi:hypothetical protein